MNTKNLTYLIFLLFAFICSESFAASIDSNKFDAEGSVLSNLLPIPEDSFISDKWHKEDFFQSKSEVSYDKVPLAQYNNSWTVHFTIYFTIKSLYIGGVFREIFAAFGFYIFFLHLCAYFGFWPTFTPPTGSRFFTLHFKLERINYYPSKEFVSMKRFAMTPLFWFSEILMLLSEEDFQVFEQYLSRKTLMIIFSVLGLHAGGAYDHFDKYLQYIFEKILPISAQK